MKDRSFRVSIATITWTPHDVQAPTPEAAYALARACHKEGQSKVCDHNAEQYETSWSDIEGTNEIAPAVQELDDQLEPVEGWTVQDEAGTDLMEDGTV